MLFEHEMGEKNGEEKTTIRETVSTEYGIGKWCKYFYTGGTFIY